LIHQRHHRSVLYEVKYRDDLRAHWQDYRSKFKAARRYACTQGWVFRLITEREIRTPYLKNATFLGPNPTSLLPGAISLAETVV
jgi:hypothetical protein